jgi:two-component system OmpR family response regulator
MLAKRRILVAEDDPDIRLLIRTRLQMAGYEVDVARNGAEAITRIVGMQPDAVILDINMPEVDGFGVLAALKDMPQRPAVLMLTARHSTEDVQRAISLGAKDYLSKPFTETQLLARVARLLRAPIETSNAVRL